MVAASKDLTRLVVLAQSMQRDQKSMDYLTAELSSRLTISKALVASNQSSEIIDVLADADFAIIGRELISKEVVASLPKLNAISKYGVGLDNIDLEACTEFGVGVHHLPGVNARFVAEHSLGMMIGLMRNLAKCDRKLRDGTWHKDGGQSLFGQVVAIVGFGRIGQELAQMLSSCFSCELLAVDILDKKKEALSLGARQVSLNQALARAKVVSLHLPLDQSTQKMVSEDFIGQMRPDAVLINTSRGEVIDGQALHQALSTAKIGGAALDVYEDEPLGAQRFVGFDNVLLTPHTAGNSDQAVYEMSKAAVDGIKQALNKKAEIDRGALDGTD